MREQQYFLLRKQNKLKILTANENTERDIDLGEVYIGNEYIYWTPLADSYTWLGFCGVHKMMLCLENSSVQLTVLNTLLGGEWLSKVIS